jgi:threonine dehydratase
MKHSVDLGRLEALPGIKTIADTLAPQSVSQKTLDLANRYVDDIVLVEDAAMMDAQRWLWLHYNQMVEPAGVAVIAALPQVDIGKYQHPVALICGGNASADPIWQYYTDVATKKGTIPSKG